MRNFDATRDPVLYEHMNIVMATMMSSWNDFCSLAKHKIDVCKMVWEPIDDNQAKESWGI